MGETHKGRQDLALQVIRGQRGDGRLSETGETNVVLLITQRSHRCLRPGPLRPTSTYADQLCRAVGSRPEELHSRHAPRQAADPS